MERRDFIKAVGVALSAAVVPASGKTLTLKKPAMTATEMRYGGFDAKRVCGRSVDFQNRSEEAVEIASDALLKDARSFLPRGTKFYVLDGGSHRIWKEGKAQESDILAWLYSPTPLQAPVMAKVIAEVTA